MWRQGVDQAQRKSLASGNLEAIWQERHESDRALAIAMNQLKSYSLAAMALYK